MELENLQLIKFDKMCRTCLKEGQLLTSLYDGNNKNGCLYKKIEMCTSIKCDKNDGLPDKICPKCIDELIQSYNFANKSIINDATLKQYLKKRNNKSVESIGNEVTCINIDDDDDDDNEEILIKDEYEDESKDELFYILNKVIKNTGIRIIDTDTNDLIIKEETEVIDLTTEIEEEDEVQQIEIPNINNGNIEGNESNQINMLFKENQNSNFCETKLEDTNKNKTKTKQDEKSTVAATSSQINDILIEAKETTNICDKKLKETEQEQHKKSTVAATPPTDDSSENRNKKRDYNGATIDNNDTLSKNQLVTNNKDTNETQMYDLPDEMTNHKNIYKLPNQKFIVIENKSLVVTSSIQNSLKEVDSNDIEVPNINNVNRSFSNIKENETNQINNPLIKVKHISKLKETNINKTQPEQHETSTAPTSCKQHSMITRRKTILKDSLLIEKNLKETTKNKEVTEQPKKSTVPSSIESSLEPQRKKAKYSETKINCNDSLIEKNLKKTTKNKEVTEQPKKSTVPISIESSLEQQRKKAKYSETKINCNDSLIEKKLEETKLNVDNNNKTTINNTGAIPKKQSDINEKVPNKSEICNGSDSITTNNKLFKQIIVKKNSSGSYVIINYPLNHKIIEKSNNIEILNIQNINIKETESNHTKEASNRPENQLKDANKNTESPEQHKKPTSSTGPIEAPITASDEKQTNRVFKCDECPKTYKQLAHLVEHQKLHIIERPYKCRTCSMIFESFAQLVQHKVTHMNDRPYKCGSCDQSFISSYLLHLHKKVHNANSEIRCSKCLLKFSQASHLREHLMKKICKVYFNCETCGDTFSYRKDYYKHRSRNNCTRIIQK